MEGTEALAIDGSVTDNKSTEDGSKSLQKSSLKNKLGRLSAGTEKSAHKLKRRSSQILGHVKKDSKSGEETSSTAPQASVFLQPTSPQAGEDDCGRQSSGETANEAKETNGAEEVTPSSVAVATIATASVKHTFSPGFPAQDHPGRPLQPTGNPIPPNWPPIRTKVGAPLSPLSENLEPRVTEQIPSPPSQRFPLDAASPLSDTFNAFILRRDEEELEAMDQVSAETYLGFVGVMWKLSQISAGIEAIGADVIDIKGNKSKKEERNPASESSELALEELVRMLKDAHEEKVGALQTELCALKTELQLARKNNEQLASLLYSEKEKTSATTAPGYKGGTTCVNSRTLNRIVLAGQLMNANSKTK